MKAYAYSDYLWLPLLLAVFVAFLASYGWRRRTVQGALPFFIGCLFAVAWCIGSLLETAAVDPNTKIFWLRFLTLWQLPIVSAATCFALQYSGLDRWLTRRNVALLAAPPVVFMAFILTDGLHHLVWTGFTFDGAHVTGIRGPVLLVFLTYSYLLFFVNICILSWLFITSPRHRAPAALMVVGQISARIVFELSTRAGFLSQWNADPFVLGVVFGLYALALFRFHVFDPVRVARAAAIDQMFEGMLVVDSLGHMVDANLAAQRMLGIRVAETRGHRVTELLPAVGEAVNGTIGSRNEGETEFELGCGRSAQQYRMNVTPLRGKHGEELGHLLLLHDITSERRTQARLLEQERVVATLQERERLARELHDGVGQVLGYLSLQTHAVRKRLQEGEGEKVDSQLLRLATVAQNAHGEVRESIFALTAASSANWSFLSTLRRYLNEFQANYGLDAELTVADGVDESLFDSHSAVQLLRVVQEAVTNARKHAGACTVRVIVDARGGHACIKICDDGCGFDADGLGHDRDGHFGLAFMRERMAHIGGSVEIESRPGGGTQVTLDAPVRNGDGR